jgi:hypothetical protein
MSTQAMYVEDEINEQSQQLAQLSLGEERRERDGMFVVLTVYHCPLRHIRLPTY